MLHLNSQELSDVSKSYLLSVLFRPKEVIDKVTKCFNEHLDALSVYDSSDSNTTQVRCIIDLISKDYCLIFELNRVIVDLMKDCSIKVFSDSYLEFVDASFRSVMKKFKEAK